MFESLFPHIKASKKVYSYSNIRLYFVHVALHSLSMGLINYLQMAFQNSFSKQQGARARWICIFILVKLNNLSRMELE